MAPLPDVPNVLRARVLFTVAGKPDQGVRSFWKWTGTAPTVTDLNTLAYDLWHALLEAGIKGAMSDSITMTQIILEDLTSDTSATGSFSTSAVGTRSGVALPADACFVSSFEIPRRYRGGHPRSYWPFGTDTDLTGPQKFKDASVAAFVTVVTTAFATFKGKTEGGCTIGAHSNVSYYKGFTAVENPLTGRYRNVPTLRATPVVTAVASVVGRSYVGSFRKRRFKTS